MTSRHLMHFPLFSERLSKPVALDPTPEQRLILDHPPTQHARVLAGPGTGKSFTMVRLLQNLVRDSPRIRVRMLSFTRAATAELAQKFTETSQTASTSTVHSFAISVLMQNPGVSGLPEPLRIADTWETDNIVKPTLAKRLGVTLPVLKRLLIEMEANFQSLQEEHNETIPSALRLRFRGAWGEHRQVFGYTLLQELPFALLRALKQHDDLAGIDLDLLIVDEYQDLNACDLGMLHLVSQHSGCAVIGTGDDDQSIYSWRKAAPEGIRNLLCDYRPARDYSLSVTQRCGKRIIEWATQVISGDPDRPAGRPPLRPADDSPDGEVAMLRFQSNDQEAKGVAALVSGLIARQGLSPRDILVLMRSDHNQKFSKPIGTELKELSIPCSDSDQVKRLLDEDSVRRWLALFRLLENREDSLAWATLLHLTSGVGARFRDDYIYDAARKTGGTFGSVLLQRYAAGFGDGPRSAGQARTTVAAALRWVDEQELPENGAENGWGHWIIERTARGHFPQLPDEFRSLLVEIDESLEHAPTQHNSLGRYVGQIDPLGTDLRTSSDEGVRLMTMARSKGLTVRASIVVGLEENLMPWPNADRSEERRLLYVAMTRAKEYLYCTWTQYRQGVSAYAGHQGSGRRSLCPFLEETDMEPCDGFTFVKKRFDI